MTTLKVISLYLLLGLLSSAPASAVVDAGTMDVVGWPVPDLKGPAPSLDAGDDPVYGRQVCPPLTRLNLAEKKSEELLLRKAVEEFHDAERGALWRLELRQGIFWWNGAEVSAQDVAAYLTSTLPALVKSRGGGIWSLPRFVAKADGPGAVTVKWEQAPAFGPFLLNGAAFYRSAEPKTNGGIAYECAGLYRPHIESWGVALTATPGYKSRRPLPEVRIYNDESHAKPGNGHRLELRYASALVASPAALPIAASPAHCAHTMDLPYATMIVWNPKKQPTANVAFRRALTQLVPRGTLASAGTSALADVASGPVPRQHPGYNAKVTTEPFDIKAASLQLNHLGFRRKTADSPRLDANGQPLKLVILTQAGTPGLPEKVLMDAYSAVGITVQFKAAEKGQPLVKNDQADGILAAFSLDWPRVSFLANLHTAAASPAPFWPLGDKELDKDLEAYAASLTTQAPNFSLLGAVHKRLAELEPVTVLLQHKACIETGSALRLAKGGLNPKDPDWFRQLLF